MPDKKLNIVITVDPEIPVPPLYYGGIERIVDMLVRGLIERGHKVYLFAHPDSKTQGTLIPWRGGKSGSLIDTLINVLQVSDYLRRVKNIDIVHSYSRLVYLLALMRSRIPKIQSYQRHITPRSVCLGGLLGGDSLVFTACSRYLCEKINFKNNRCVVVPNGVPIDTYRYVPQVSLDAPLLYLGRIERIKGVHTAIEVAKITGRRLIIAGNYTSGDDYFKNHVLAQCDGKTVTYVGAVDDKQKNILLGEAATLLFPVEWGEPFGIVMVEALACGTPVIALNKGAVPEVIKDGVTGFNCDSLREMAEAVNKIGIIKRSDCRTYVEREFSDQVIIGKYEELYYSLIK